MILAGIAVWAYLNGHFYVVGFLIAQILASTLLDGLKAAKPNLFK